MIECLQRDVVCMLCYIFYYIFKVMEELGVFNCGNDIYFFVFYFVFC